MSFLPPSPLSLFLARVDTGQYVDAFRAAYDGSVHVHSFEPLEVTYKKLVELKRDDPRVHVRQIAMTNFTGTVTFYSPPISPVKNDLFEFPTGASIGASEGSSVAIGEVPATTVDAFLERLQSPAGGVSWDEGRLPPGQPGEPPADVLFMKVDVEGADFAVLRGAREALASGRVQALQFEANFKW